MLERVGFVFVFNVYAFMDLVYVFVLGLLVDFLDWWFLRLVFCFVFVLFALRDVVGGGFAGLFGALV